MNFLRLLIVTVILASTSNISFAKECRKANMLNMHKDFSNIKIAPAAQPIKIEQASDDLKSSGKKIEFFSTTLKKVSSIDEYIEKNCVNAILVAKDGRLVYERYSQWTEPSDKLYSASLAKTLTSIMVGILLDEKKLELSTKISEIYPELAKSAFADDSIEDILRMNSSAKLRDCYEDCSDGDNQSLNPLISPRTNTLEYLSKKVDRGEKPFFYSATNTAILGLIIERVSGMAPASFWADKVWTTIGAESDGYWIVNSRKEIGFQCCYTATARDWLKIGIMLSNYGEINKNRILSREYVNAMTSGNLKNPQPQRKHGYGLHVWVPRNSPRGDSKTLEMVGAYGQYLLIDPVAKIVVFHSGNSRAANSLFTDWDNLSIAIQNSLK